MLAEEVLDHFFKNLAKKNISKAAKELKDFLESKDLLVEKKLLLLQSITLKEIEKTNKLYFYLKIIFPASILLVIYNGFTNLLFKNVHDCQDVSLVFDILRTIAIIYIMLSIGMICFLDFMDLVIKSKKKKFIKSIDWILLELDIHEKK